MFARNLLDRQPLVSEIVDLVREVIARYGRLGASQFAAAISYRALFSLIPLATFVATILAQVLSAGEGNRQDLITAITDQFDLNPDGVARLDALIDAVPSPWSLAGIIALGLALWGATGVMSSMLKTLAVVFDEGIARTFVRGRIVSALLVLGALALILCAVIVSMLENAVSKVSDNVQEALGWQPFGFGILFGVVVPLGLSFAVFLLLYRYLPHQQPGWRAALLGSGAAAIGFQGVQVGLGWYLSGPADFSKVYGSASAVFVFLFSVYLSALTFVICAIITAVLDERLPLRR
jgi:membrane protein